MPNFLENVSPGELLTKWADLGALMPTQDIFFVELEHLCLCNM